MLSVFSILAIRFFTTILPVFDISPGTSAPDESGVNGIAFPLPNSINLLQLKWHQPLNGKKMSVKRNKKIKQQDFKINENLFQLILS